MGSLLEPMAGPVVAYLLVATATAIVLPTAAWLVLRAFRIRSAAHRHAVWLCCLVGIALFPVLRVAGPKMSLAVFRAPPAPVAVPSPSRPDSQQLADPLPTEIAEEPVAVSAAPELGGDVEPWTQQQITHSRPRASVREVVAGLWLAGALAMLVRVGLATVRLRRLVGRASGLNETERGKLGASLPARVRVKVSGEVGSPVCTGLLRPCVLLPGDWFATTDPARLRLAMRHELAHVERRDCLFTLFQRLLEAVLFFHPLVWLASGSLARERERVCDNYVLVDGGHAPEYAGLLADMAELGLAGAPLGGSALFEGDLLSRVRALLDPAASRVTRVSRRYAATLWLGMLVVLVGGGAIRLTAKPAARDQAVALVLTAELCEYPFVGTPLRFRRGQWQGVPDPPPKILDTRVYRFGVPGSGDHSLTAKAEDGSSAVLRLRDLTVGADLVEMAEWGFTSTWQPSYRFPQGGGVDWHGLRGGDRSDSRPMVLPAEDAIDRHFTVWLSGMVSADPPRSCCVRVRLTLTQEKQAAERAGPARMVNGIGVRLIRVEPGRLSVSDGRTIAVAEPYYLGEFEVTQDQWSRVMGNAPSRFEGAGRPVEMVSWLDCVEFCKRLSKLEGRAYRLPTAAEWEFACRAGSKAAFCFGNDESELGDYAWYGANSGEGTDEHGNALDGSTRPVGQKEPNAWGFHDMHGNVAEFCADDRRPRKATLERQRAAGAKSVIPSHPYKGGSFGQSQRCCRADFEDLYPPEWKSFIIGFRVALDVSAVAASQPEAGARPEIRQAIGDLRSSDGSIRMRAAMALNRPDAQAAVPALIEALADGDPEIRKWVSGALARIGGDEALAALVAHWRDEGDGARWYIHGALRQCAKEIVPAALDALGDSRPSIRREAAYLLGLAAVPATRGPLERAFLNDPDPTVQRSAAAALARFGGSAVDTLIAATEHTDPDTRTAAAVALAGVKEPRCIPTLLRLLQDTGDSPDVRDSARRGLAAMPEESLQPLVGLLASPDPAARAAAVYGLGALESTAAVPHLLAAIRDPDRGVRVRAARALRSHVAEPAVVDAFLAALADDSIGVVDTAAAALGRAGDQRAGQPLLALLHNGRGSRGTILVALAGLGEKQALAPALRALDDEASHVRRDAAAALGLLGDSAAIEPLAAILENRKESPQTRAAAARALGRIGGPQVVPPLIAASRRNHPNRDRDADAALVQVGRDAIPALSALQKQSDGFTKTWAATLIQQIERKSATTGR